MLNTGPEADQIVNLCPPGMLCRLYKGDEKAVPHLSVHLHAHHNSITVNNLMKVIDRFKAFAWFVIT